MKRLVLIGGLLAGGTALAHEGVKNPVVAHRMHTMTEIGKATKVLGDMAKGVVAFDAGLATAAVREIGAKADQIVDQFRAKEEDPKSEALPAIWTDFSGFSNKAVALKVAADGVGNLATLDQVRAALPQIGATCSACHKAYRE